MSNSTSTHRDRWNAADDFVLFLSSSTNPIDQGLEEFDKLLGIIDSLSNDLRPDRIYSGKRKRKYSRQALKKHLGEMDLGYTTAFTLDRTRPPDASFRLHFDPKDSVERLTLDLTIGSFFFAQEPSRAEFFVTQITDLLRAFARHFPIIRGLGHSWTDYCLGEDRPSAKQPRDRPYHELYWLNVYGPALVEQLGRQRVLSTPASHLEELAGGAVLLLTRPTPLDFDSQPARLAQARALVHLHPHLSLDSVLSRLLQRSLAFSPLPTTFHEDVAPILQRKLDFEGLPHRRQWVERFNLYRPPDVSEWLPAQDAPASDVEDIPQAIESYEGLLAEQLIALMHSYDVRHVMDGSLESLPEVDFTLWQRGWGHSMEPDGKEALIPALGAWLGMYLVHCLGGRWIPRRSLEETLVVVGSRAWLPFLRARHALQGVDSPLDFSCTQLFRQARLFSSPARVP